MVHRRHTPTQTLLSEQTINATRRPEPNSGLRFLKLTQLAEVLNVSEPQAYALVRSGTIPGIKVGGRGQWRIEPTDYLGFRTRPDREAQISTVMTRHQRASLLALEAARR